MESKGKTAVVRSSESVIGYKIVDCNLQGKNRFQYTVGQPHEVFDGEIILGQRGLHYALFASDCYQYIPDYKRPLRYLKVVSGKETVRAEDAEIIGTVQVARRLFVSKELSGSDWLSVVRSEVDAGFRSPTILLNAAAAENDITMMQSCISSFNLLKRDICEAVCWAAMGGHQDAILFIHMKTEGKSAVAAFMWAVDGGDLDAVQYAIKLATDTKTSLKLSNFHTAQLWAKSKNHRDISLYLSTALDDIRSKLED